MRPIGEEEHAGMVGQVGTHPDQTLVSQPTSMAAPAALMEELIEEILLRFPPHEPARLVRATLICKPWCRLIFCRRFRELHRTPPLLGFLHRGITGSEGANLTRFVPMAAFCTPCVEMSCWRPLDARHGCVLLRCPMEFSDMDEHELLVWDPITDDKRKLPFPLHSTYSWTAVVLCSGAGDCDHLDCHRGPFLVVFVGSESGKTFICTYSSDAASWSDPISIQDTEVRMHSLMCGALVGNTLYFGFPSTDTALKYDVESREMSWIQLPPTCSNLGNLGLRVLTTTEDGGLGLATAHGNKIYMWSSKDGSKVDAGWTQDSVIELERLFPSAAILVSPDVVCFVEGVSVIFVRLRNVLYTIDVKTCKVKKVCKGRGIRAVVPYMNFYTPVLGAACSVEGPSSGDSSA